MISFGLKKSTNAPFITRVRRWVEDALPPEHADTAVMVNELQCFEPGCAPIETVVTLLEERRPLMFKLFKPIREVGPEEVLAELRAVLDGRAAAEHQAFGGGGGGAGGGDERTSEPPVAH